MVAPQKIAKVVWQTSLDVNKVVNKLKELNNIFHKDLNESAVDDIANKQYCFFVVIKVQVAILSSILWMVYACSRAIYIVFGN